MFVNRSYPLIQEFPFGLVLLRILTLGFEDEIRSGMGVIAPFPNPYAASCPL
jgi:hypothetical protein